MTTESPFKTPTTKISIKKPSKLQSPQGFVDTKFSESPQNGANSSANKAMQLIALPKGMQPEMRHYQSIRRSPGNPRKNAHAVPAVAASLKEFGWRQPIVLDANDDIVVGDTRYQAAVSLITSDAKWAWMPCVSASDLSPEQIIAYRAADNRTGELADWDHDKLMADLKAIGDMDFDLAAMGFNAEELGQLAEYADPAVYTKHLQDFDTMPAPRPRWIMIAAPEDVATDILGVLKGHAMYGACRVQYSGDPALGADL